MKCKIIWYDMEGEKGTDILEGTSEEDIVNKGFLKYNGNPPAKLYTVIKMEG